MQDKIVSTYKFKGINNYFDFIKLSCRRNDY